MKINKLLLGLLTLIIGFAVVGSTYAANGPQRGPADNSMKDDRVMATVTAISGNSITVVSKKGSANSTAMTETTYIVDASSATIKKITKADTTDAKPIETTIAVSGIVVNDNLTIQGTVSGTNIVAKQITVGAFGGQIQNRSNGANGIMGTIVSISGTTITMTKQEGKDSSATTYTVDASTATFKETGKDKEAITISSLSIGDRIEVLGTASGTTIKADSIIKMNGQQNGNDNGAAIKKENRAGFFSNIFNGIRNFFGKMFK